MQEFDVVIIGSGPGGEGAAMRLARSGKRVAVMEAHHQLGGGYTHLSAISSKALRHSVQLLADYRHHPLFEHTLGNMDVTYPDLLAEAHDAITSQVRLRNHYYPRNHVTAVHGFASFDDAHTLTVTQDNGSTEKLRAEHFVIATGSTPYHPDDIDFNHPHVLDSDKILQLDYTPESITIYGAGVIGCEYASIFANLDLRVNLINTRPSLLSFMDTEITDALSYHLRDQGVLIRHNDSYAQIEAGEDDVVLHCQSGAKFRSDVLLWANGRTGNTANMGLDQIGISLNHRGQIEVNEFLQTSAPHIYALGDVIGPPGLASASYDQGRFAGAHIAMGRCDWSLVKDVPTGIYTSPGISSLGKTEQELTEAGVPFEVGKAEFKHLARAQITGHTTGMLKLLFHRESHEILGIHCFGEDAAEIIHIGQAIMSQKGDANSINYFTETTFNYPTMAEAYRIAGLNGLNKLF
ncbi:MAG TPA: Si-specific NAD(P)(+) transhydrogenase [Gammaproteobacteria bacterium]|nr:Si-specific NAD(P)(+) transhydrogenase [Gammaproteobacteria bacterium]